MRAIIQTSHAPAAIGTYSQAIKAGNTVYMSGQIPLDPVSMELVEGSAAAMTAGVFFTMSAMARRTTMNMNKLGSFLGAGAIVLMIAVVANIFLNIPALSLTIAAGFVVFSSLMIMWQVRTVIDGGEVSHISAALTIFISIYNIFSSLLRILISLSGDD